MQRSAMSTQQCLGLNVELRRVVHFHDFTTGIVLSQLEVLTPSLKKHSLCGKGSVESGFALSSNCGQKLLVISGDELLNPGLELRGCMWCLAAEPASPRTVPLAWLRRNLSAGGVLGCDLFGSFFGDAFGVTIHSREAS